MTTGHSAFGDRVAVIAEIGSNHDGDLGRALEMIDMAADAGADIAKFQAFQADDMVARGSAEHTLLKQLEVPREWYPKLMRRCADRGVRFLSTATSQTTMDWMEEFGAWGYKVASGNITYFQMIERLIEIGKPVILSTGLGSLDDVKTVVGRICRGGLDDVAVLHCVSRYPARPEDMRLANIKVLAEELPCAIGFSDHSTTLSFAIAAVALGARIVEKHVTLDGEGISPDHAFALRPDAFSAMVAAIRETEAGLFSDFSYDPTTAFAMRRSLHFARAMQPGETVTEADLKISRPEDGLPPERLGDVVGRRLRAAAEADGAVTESCFEETMSR